MHGSFRRYIVTIRMQHATLPPSADHHTMNFQKTNTTLSVLVAILICSSGSRLHAAESSAIIPDIKEPVPDDMALPAPTPVPQPPLLAAPQTKPASTPRPHHHASPSNRPLSKKSQAPSGGQKGARQAQPDYLHNPPPVYPEQARVEHRQGVVLLMVSVSDSGDPTSVSVSRSSGYTDFDDSALRAVRRWRFRPASAGGMNIPSTVGVPVNFELH